MRATLLGRDIDELLAQSLAVVGTGPKPRQQRQGLGILALRATDHASLASAFAAVDRL